MAGHSKFSNIKHKKAKEDSKRAITFTKLSKEITIATKLGGDILDFNPRLRAAIDKAKVANIPKDKIENAIRKGTKQDSESLFDVRYEGYGVGGVAVIVDGVTDNKNRTASEVRHAFTKHGGSLGDVSWLFDKKGIIILKKDMEEAIIVEKAIELGAEDVEIDEENYIIITSPDNFYEIVGNFPDKVDALITMIPQNKISLEGDDKEKFLKMIDHLENLDDVQEVHSNHE